MNRSIVAVALTSIAGLLAGNVAAMEGEAGLHFVDFDEMGSGVGVHGHLDVMDQVRVRGEFSSAEHLDLLGWSGAYVIDMDAMEMELGGLYEFWDFEGALEDDVYGAYGRFNYSPMEALNLYGQLKFVSFDNLGESDTVIGLGGDYAVTDQIGVSLGVDMHTSDALWGDDTPMFLRLGASFRF